MFFFVFLTREFHIDISIMYIYIDTHIYRYTYAFFVYPQKLHIIHQQLILTFNICSPPDLCFSMMENPGLMFWTRSTMPWWMKSRHSPCFFFRKTTVVSPRFFRYLKLRVAEKNLIFGYFWGWVFSYIRRVHTAYIGEYIHFRYLFGDGCLVSTSGEYNIFG